MAEDIAVRRDCPYCNGVGSVGTPGAACPTCGGTGQKPQWLRDLRAAHSERSQALPASKEQVYYFWTRTGMCKTDGPVCDSTYVASADFKRLTRELADARTDAQRAHTHAVAECQDNDRLRAALVAARPYVMMVRPSTGAFDFPRKIIDQIDAALSGEPTDSGHETEKDHV